MGTLFKFNPVATAFIILFMGIGVYHFYSFGTTWLSDNHIGMFSALGLIYSSSVLMIALCFYIVMKITK